MTPSKTRSPAKTARAAKPQTAPLGPLPEWDLTDLYPGIDSIEVKRDLDRADSACVAFEESYKGKLAELAGRTGGLIEAVKRYETIDDLLGRLGSYAGLIYASNTADPKGAKFYGDVQERLTAASLHLLFFALELNRIDDAVLERAMAEPALGYYRPWFEDVRKEKPYQLDDKLEQLFHEKSTTAYSAWNRLFDETMTALRFDVDGEELAIEPTLHLLAGPRRRRNAKLPQRRWR